MKKAFAVLVATSLLAAVPLSAQPAQDPRPTSTLKKGIIPLVGSTIGANGARFKTSLRIYPTPGAHGRIVFHPMGAIASDSDPSMPYAFPETARTVTDYLQYDDVVAAMGQTGLGTLDIIPDYNGGNVLPTVRVLLYNDTGNGTFGTESPMVIPRDYYYPLFSDGGASYIVAFTDPTLVAPTTAGYRRNIGFRTLSPVTLTTCIFHKDGTQEVLPMKSYPGDYSALMPIEQFIGKPLAPEESVTVRYQDGKAIVYYTYTDNRTNDPTLVVTPAQSANVHLVDVYP